MLAINLSQDHWDTNRTREPAIVDSLLSTAAGIRRINPSLLANRILADKIGEISMAKVARSILVTKAIAVAVAARLPILAAD